MMYIHGTHKIINDANEETKEAEKNNYKRKCKNGSEKHTGTAVSSNEQSRLGSYDLCPRRHL